MSDKGVAFCGAAGELAFKKGKKLVDCPYKKNGAAKSAWLNGWLKQYHEKYQLKLPIRV